MPLAPQSATPPASLPQTLVVVHRPQPSKTALYERWLRRSAEAEARFPGFLSREVIEPTPEGQDFYTLVIRFDSSDNLSAWLQSDEWADLHSQVDELLESADRFSTDPKYLTPFWYRPSPQSAQAPTWKIWLSTVVALYPSIFAISLLLQYVTFPFAATLLLSNLLAVACVSWIAGPIVRRIAQTWMTAGSDKTRITVLGTLGLIATLLALMAIFLQVPVGT